MSIRKHGLALEPLTSGVFMHVGRFELHVMYNDIPDEHWRRFGWRRDTSGFWWLYAGSTLVIFGRAAADCVYGSHCV